MTSLSMETIEREFAEAIFYIHLRWWCYQNILFQIARSHLHNHIVSAENFSLSHPQQTPLIK